MNSSTGKILASCFNLVTLKKTDDLHEPQQRLLQEMKGIHADVAQTITLSESFVAMVRERKEPSLSDWLTSAEPSGLKTFVNFAKGLKRDEAAIRAALSLPWSDGPTEGFLNKFKNIKRQMYGRAKLDLLQIRWLAWWG